MARFNTGSFSPAAGRMLHGTNALAAQGTNEGARGYKFVDPRKELFITAVSTMMEDTFYEAAEARNERIAKLVEEVAATDARWLYSFVAWLRFKANLRSVSLFIAVVAAHAFIEGKRMGARDMIAGVLGRADEPGEILAIWHARYGRSVPSAVKRGINDKLGTLWTDYSVAKYAGTSAAFSMADVMNITHPKRLEPIGGYIMARAYGREAAFDMSELPTLQAKWRMQNALTPESRREIALEELRKGTPLTWEAVSSAVGKPDAEVWEAVLPTMGYMARLRSIKRVAEAGVSDTALDALGAYLQDPANVKKSKVLPLQFLAAYRENSLRFSYALEMALNASVANVPVLKGRTLVLVDRSGSMQASVSEKSTLTRADAANVFGAAIARRAESATFIDYATTSEYVDVNRFKSVLDVADRPNTVGHATLTQTAVHRWYSDHDRVIILTDDQPHDGDPGAAVPANVPVYLWNLGGYSIGGFKTGPKRHILGGLSDASFGVVPLLEAGRDQGWPWETQD